MDESNMILDSGDRREFESGAVRDIQKGKGRCDLMPLSAVGLIFKTEQNDLAAQIFQCIDTYVYDGNVFELAKAIALFTGIKVECTPEEFNDNIIKNTVDLLLDASIHYEQGCEKYGERNWEKGIPVHSYIDSGVRHLLKHLRGDDDERHDRAFVWNMLGAIHTHIYRFDLVDLPCRSVIEERIRAEEKAAMEQNAAKQQQVQSDEASIQPTEIIEDHIVEG